jgi:NOL1/NOP2/fmu family ribosome biogenesis protein
MVVTLSNRGKVIFLEMEKFQRWIVGRDIEWAHHVDIFDLLDAQLNPI